MSELNDSAELQLYSSAVLYVLSAVAPPPEYTGIILEHFVNAIKSAEVYSIPLLVQHQAEVMRSILGMEDTLERLTDPRSIPISEFIEHSR
jgi:proteasome activator subunit 4